MRPVNRQYFRGEAVEFEKSYFSAKGPEGEKRRGDYRKGMYATEPYHKGLIENNEDGLRIPFDNNTSHYVYHEVKEWFEEMEVVLGGKKPEAVSIPRLTPGEWSGGIVVPAPTLQGNVVTTHPVREEPLVLERDNLTEKIEIHHSKKK